MNMKKENKTNTVDLEYEKQETSTLANPTITLPKKSSTKIPDEQKTALKPVFELPALPYASDALEPYLDKMTMEIHHDKHHGTYVSNLNRALENVKDVPPSIELIIKNISKYSTTVRNNGGGHFNHSMFWKLMKPNGGGHPKGKLAEAINASFNSFDNFKNKFNEAAGKIFGSGWAWLVVKNGKLEIGTTPNQDNPLMDISAFQGKPVLCLDIWEHAYYLKYQNRRAEYISGWWNVINWDEAENNFLQAKSK